MQFYSDSEFYTFDDVCLVPQYSEVSSRKDVSLKTGLLNLELPIISANMDTVTGIEMLLAMYNAGGLGILHRFLNFDSLVGQVSTFYKELGKEAFNSLALSVGVKDSKEFIEFCTSKARIICVDIAHGHSKHTIETIKYIKKLNKDSIVIAGNVATAAGVIDLIFAGAQIIKIGIGSGGFCTTRIVTGHGIPQLSAISICSEVAKRHGAEIIADGGIRNSGDIAKSLAAGANYVMLGSLLSATNEAPGKVVNINGSLFKEYRGSASFETQIASGKEKSQIVPEGVAQMKPCKGPVNDVLFQLSGGLRSALSYSGAFNIKEFQEKAKFVRVTSNSYIEGTPHGLNQRP